MCIRDSSSHDIFDAKFTTGTKLLLMLRGAYPLACCIASVSYTHLDVYKRQMCKYSHPAFSTFFTSSNNLAKSADSIDGANLIILSISFYLVYFA